MALQPKNSIVVNGIPGNEQQAIPDKEYPVLMPNETMVWGTDRHGKVQNDKLVEDDKTYPQPAYLANNKFWEAGKTLSLRLPERKNINRILYDLEASLGDDEEFAAQSKYYEKYKSDGILSGRYSQLYGKRLTDELPEGATATGSGVWPLVNTQETQQAWIFCETEETPTETNPDPDPGTRWLITYEYLYENSSSPVTFKFKFKEFGDFNKDYIDELLTEEQQEERTARDNLNDDNRKQTIIQSNWGNDGGYGSEIPLWGYLNAVQAGSSQAHPKLDFLVWSINSTGSIAIIAVTTPEWKDAPYVSTWLKAEVEMESYTLPKENPQDPDVKIRRPKIALSVLYGKKATLGLDADHYEYTSDGSLKNEGAPTGDPSPEKYLSTLSGDNDFGPVTYKDRNIQQVGYSGPRILSVFYYQPPEPEGYLGLEGQQEPEKDVFVTYTLETFLNCTFTSEPPEIDGKLATQLAESDVYETMRITSSMGQMIEFTYWEHVDSYGAIDVSNTSDRRRYTYQQTIVRMSPHNKYAGGSLLRPSIQSYIYEDERQASGFYDDMPNVDYGSGSDTGQDWVEVYDWEWHPENRYMIKGVEVHEEEIFGGNPNYWGYSELKVRAVCLHPMVWGMNMFRWPVGIDTYDVEWTKDYIYPGGVGDGDDRPDRPNATFGLSDNDSLELNFCTPVNGPWSTYDPFTGEFEHNLSKATGKV